MERPLETLETSQINSYLVYGETEAHKGEIACPESHSSQLQNIRPMPEPLGPWEFLFYYAQMVFRTHCPKEIISTETHTYFG